LVAAEKIGNSVPIDLRIGGHWKAEDRMRRFTGLSYGAEGTFADRREAGRVLADALATYRGATDVLVLGLPRGGVPVAWEVAAALHAPLNVFVVRKLGAPGWEELAVGALASGGLVVLNDDVVRSLRISDEHLQQVIAGKTVILVDDGIATGASMLAATRAIRAAGPAKIVVAVPVAPPSACRQLADAADDLVCVWAPASFLAVGEYYCDFSQTSDDEVRKLLATPTR
jgi:putative phosphoribosyl transferase